MAQLQVEDLSPILIQQLETLAKLHRRSLQEEIKHILQQAAQTASSTKPTPLLPYRR
jgi:plasmid stability protein